MDYAEIGRQWLVSVLFFRVAETTYVLFLVPPDGCTFDYFNGQTNYIVSRKRAMLQKVACKEFLKEYQSSGRFG